MPLVNRIAPRGACRLSLAAVIVALCQSAPAGEAGRGPVIRAGSAELRFVGPYRAGRVPVVFIHGLLGGPENWSGMIEQLSGDPAVRDHLQLATFRYDSLEPIPDAGGRLRAALDEARRRLDPEGRDPAFDRVVLVGHSLGGLVAKVAAQQDDPQSAGASNAPPSGIGRPIAPRIGRLIFVATPHRGSPVNRGAVRSASSWLARNLIGQPETGVSSETSVDQLTWDHPLLADLERARAAEGVPFHSVIAALRDPSAEGATDGLVPVASARLAGARSEMVVRTHHVCFQHPKVVGEVRRVLIEHATSPARSRARCLQEWRPAPPCDRCCQPRPIAPEGRGPRPQGPDRAPLAPGPRPSTMSGVAREIDHRNGERMP